MTVGELIKQLQVEDSGRLVVAAKDSEGNSYSPLDSFWIGRYRAESTWAGEVGLDVLTQDDRERGFGDEDVMVDGVPALIFCPIN